MSRLAVLQNAATHTSCCILHPPTHRHLPSYWCACRVLEALKKVVPMALKLVV